MRTACIFLSLMVIAGCGERGGPSKAEKAKAKKARDVELLALPYPKSTGVQPRTIVASYDGARDRTTITLQLDGMRVGGSGAGRVSGVTLHLSSSHPGRARGSDDPEGSVDGSVVVQTSSPGVLAYSGPPGTVTIGAMATPLKAASGDEGYTSAKNGREEVRFRFPTEAMVEAAAADGFKLSVGTLQIDIGGQHLADFREFVARMNPKP